MSPERQATLRERYPLVYGGPFLNDEPFRCGDGWFGLLDSLGAKLQALIEKEPAAGRDQHRAVQVKEKFGGLRVYLDRSSNGAMIAAINEAERAAEETCEHCGKPGQLRSTGWIRTLCDEHEAQWIADLEFRRRR